MPQVDLEPPVPTYSGGSNDRKISCETLANTVAFKPDDENELPPDFPPESICLPNDAVLDWFDRNAFLERKESAKGNCSHSTHVNLHNSSSQRLSLTLKTKSSFFGLPKSLKSSSVVDSKRKACKQANIRFFPTKRSESALKAVSAPEPVSPKVSCIGKVRSKRCPRAKAKASAKKSENSVSKPSGNKLKTGFYSIVFSMFRFSQGHKKPVQSIMEKTNDSPVQPRKSYSVEKGPASSVPADLGGMMRFKSGRRSCSWAADEIDAVLGPDREVGPNEETGVAPKS